MKKKALPKGVMVDNKFILFTGLHNTFANSHYGKKLSKEIRYSRYKPDRTTNSTWEKLLGEDVNNLKHLMFTYKLTHKFLNFQDNVKEYKSCVGFSLKEKELLLLTAITHDWEEAILGDKMTDLKIKEDREKEIEVMKIITKKFIKHKSLKIMMDIVINKILGDEKSKLGKAFNAIERLGFMITGLRAWRKSRQANNELKNGLIWMTENVLHNQTVKLIEYSNTYVFAEDYLGCNNKFISEAFNAMPNNIFMNYKDLKERENAKYNFVKAKKMWSKKVKGIYSLKIK